MKNKVALLLVTVALAGCRSSYDLTLSNGNRITGVTRPVLDKKTEQYHFKLADGRELTIPASRVRVIEPHGESSDPQFKTPKK